MKLLLKLILILCCVLVGIYAAAPWWLPYILARQLPAGWQLQELQSGYPGPAGIHIDLLRVKGEPGIAGITLAASDLHFEYRSLKTDIGLLSLDVTVYGSENVPADTFTLDDLSLPVTKLTAKLPQLSVSKMRVALHQVNGLHDEPARPLRLDFEQFELTPRSDQAYHLASRVSIAESPQLRGQLDVNVSPKLSNAFMRFPAGADIAPWLTLEISQEDAQANITTHLKAVLDSDSANREWLDSILAGGTGQVLTQLGGKLELEAHFAGRERQNIETLTLVSENLRLVSDSGTLDLNAGIQADQDGDDIAIKLLAPAKVQYQGRADWIDVLINQVVPGLQFTHGSDTKLISELGPGSRFSYQSGSEPTIGFNGDVMLDLSSTTEQLTLRSSGIQIDAGDLNKPQSTTADGLVTFTWQLNAPLSYTSEDLRLEADQLSMTGEVISRGGKLVSKGSGTLKQAKMPTHDISADEVEMTWQELDLISLTGKLGTRTHGFSAVIDDKAWTGFDLDINYTLPGKNDVKGAGLINFAMGQEFPLEFAGNTDTRRWNIKLLPATIKLAQLRKLLTVAHYQLPASIKLTDGYIEIQGDVLVDDEITANLQLGGRELGASMLKTIARQTSFTFSSGFDMTPWAIGPVTIDAINLAGGIEAANIRSEFELERSGRFALRNLHAEVLDGQLKLGSVHFTGNQTEDWQIEDTTIELSHINLGSLLAFTEIDGLAGTGFLDISLPVSSDQTGFHVKNGTFSSIGPGRLAYTREGIAGSNIGLKALENFQYKDLSGTLNYQSDGNYVLTIRLEGKNPDLYGGHPVVFNLNVNGLLPEVFESMFMTGSFEESILKQIKSQ